MAANLEARDVQVGIKQAWHNMTNVVDIVTKELAHPFEVVPCTILAQYPGEDIPLSIGGNKILIASDDKLPVGSAYQDTYVPNSIANFWRTIEEGLGDTPYKVVSAGSVYDRKWIFASISLNDGFMIGGREFKDFINVQDSFDKSMSFGVTYSNTCVVCSNTFQAALRSGKVIGKARHSKGFDQNIQRLIDALDTFAGTSAYFNNLLTAADQIETDEKEARCWIAGVNCGMQKTLERADLQRIARMTELFRHGKGNEGRTRLDAFSGITEFHTHESTRLTESGAQWMTSEFGNSAKVKQTALAALDDWSSCTDRGMKLLDKAGALI